MSKDAYSYRFFNLNTEMPSFDRGKTYRKGDDISVWLLVISFLRVRPVS